VAKWIGLKRLRRALAWVALLSLAAAPHAPAARAQTGCVFYPTTPALTDLGPREYERLVSIDPLAYQPTGFSGGLYPGGANTRPAAHEAAGQALAGQVRPLDASGQPSASGRIGLASLGMSNTATEFDAFLALAAHDPALNDRLVLVNGAAPNGVIERWVDPANPYYSRYWDYLNAQVAAAGLTPAQVQVVWVKVTRAGTQPNFPADMVSMQAQFELLARELKARFSNLKLTYFSSRTRAYQYVRGLSPEPTAFENGFAVRWLIEKQINGDPALNYDPARGPVLASWLAWGPYLWIDGLNARGDGRTWPPSMLADDCTHPSPEGARAVADMLLAFFKTDPTAAPWFLAASAPPVPTTPAPAPSGTPVAPAIRLFLPIIDAPALAARLSRSAK
jgi:hypothetical protein